MAEMKSLTIKGNYYEIVDEKARKAIERDCSPVLKETASGFYNVADDSANKPLKGLRVFGKTEQRTMTGKNILSPQSQQSYTSNGITYVINEDGSVTVNGKATAESTYIVGDVSLSAGEYYTLTGCPVGGSEYSYELTDNSYFSDYGDGSTTMYSTDISKSIRIRIASGITVNNLVFWPMVRLASIEDDSFEPYIGGVPSPSPSYPQSITGVTDTTVSVYGKNLLPYPYYFAPTGEANSGVGGSGASFTNIGNGGIKLSGTPTGYASAVLINDFMLDGDVTIGIIGNKSNATLEVNIYDENNTPVGGFTKTNKCTILKADYPGKHRINLAIKREKDNAAMSGTVFPMIVAGTTFPEEYIPYSVPQTITIPGPLHGMYNKHPETYLNSYKESNGTGYISDYVEFGSDGSGRLISRFWVITLNGQENISVYRDTDNTNAYFGFQLNVSTPAYAHDFMQKCSHFQFGQASTEGYYPNTFLCHSNGLIYVRTEIEGVNSVDTLKAWLAEQYAAGTPVQFVFARINPEVRSLSEEEIEAFKQLYSNYLNTTVTNDSEVWMETDYVADLETFVDNAVPKISISTKGGYSSSIGFYTTGKELTVHQPNGNTDTLLLSYDSIPLIDTSTGINYKVSVKNGNLVVTQA